jgi:hypothetical protein
MKAYFCGLIFVSVLIFCVSCEKLLKEPDQTSTATKMQGIWKVTEAYNEQDSSILTQISVPVTVFNLQPKNNNVISTAGPMMMYVVYGGSKFVSIASALDQVFKYNDLRTTIGDMGVKDGVVNRFTLEMRLEGVPTQTTITTLLELMGLESQYLQTCIYHKFTGVKVEFENDDNTMTWTFDDSTKAIYSARDSELNIVPWSGWSTDSFSRCRFVMTKTASTLEDIVRQAIQQNP